jgi:type II secretory pathway component PulJ
MGTQTLMDIITSAVVAGVLLLIALRLNAQSNESTMVYNSSVILQENITTLVGWIEHDFRQIGYCGGGQGYKKIPVASQAFRKADASDITFWTDLNSNGHGPDGKLDSIRWHVGTKNDSLVLLTPNPSDVPIYRDTNGHQSKGWSLGVTQFTLTYKDYLGRNLATPVSQPDQIYEIQIQIACQSPYVPQEQYRKTKSGDTSDFQVIWRQLRLAARNLKNR